MMPKPRIRRSLVDALDSVSDEDPVAKEIYRVVDGVSNEVLLADKQIEDGGRLAALANYIVRPDAAVVHIDLRNNPLHGSGVRQLSVALEALSRRIRTSTSSKLALSVAGAAGTSSKLAALDVRGCSGTEPIDSARAAWVASRADDEEQDVDRDAADMPPPGCASGLELARSLRGLPQLTILNGLSLDVELDENAAEKHAAALQEEVRRGAINKDFEETQQLLEEAAESNTDDDADQRRKSFRGGLVAAIAAKKLQRKASITREKKMVTRRVQRRRSSYIEVMINAQNADGAEDMPPPNAGAATIAAPGRGAIHVGSDESSAQALASAAKAAQDASSSNRATHDAEKMLVARRKRGPRFDWQEPHKLETSGDDATDEKDGRVPKSNAPAFTAEGAKGRRIDLSVRSDIGQLELMFLIQRATAIAEAAKAGGRLAGVARLPIVELDLSHNHALVRSAVIPQDENDNVMELGSRSGDDVLPCEEVSSCDSDDPEYVRDAVAVVKAGSDNGTRSGDYTVPPRRLAPKQRIFTFDAIHALSRALGCGTFSAIRRVRLADCALSRGLPDAGFMQWAESRSGSGPALKRWLEAPAYLAAEDWRRQQGEDDAGASASAPRPSSPSASVEATANAQYEAARMSRASAERMQRGGIEGALRLLCGAFERAATSMPQLTELDLRNNSIKDDGISALARSFSVVGGLGSTLVRLDLRGNGRRMPAPRDMAAVGVTEIRQISARAKVELGVSLLGARPGRLQFLATDQWRLERKTRQLQLGDSGSCTSSQRQIEAADLVLVAGVLRRNRRCERVILAGATVCGTYPIHDDDIIASIPAGGGAAAARAQRRRRPQRQHFASTKVAAGARTGRGGRNERTISTQWRRSGRHTLSGIAALALALADNRAVRQLDVANIDLRTRGVALLGLATAARPHGLLSEDQDNDSISQRTGVHPVIPGSDSSTTASDSKASEHNNESIDISLPPSAMCAADAADFGVRGADDDAAVAAAPPLTMRLQNNRVFGRSCSWQQFDASGIQDLTKSIMNGAAWARAALEREILQLSRDAHAAASNGLCRSDGDEAEQLLWQRFDELLGSDMALKRPVSCAVPPCVRLTSGVMSGCLRDIDLSNNVLCSEGGVELIRALAGAPASAVPRTTSAAIKSRAAGGRRLGGLLLPPTGDLNQPVLRDNPTAAKSATPTFEPLQLSHKCVLATLRGLNIGCNTLLDRETVHEPAAPEAVTALAVMLATLGQAPRLQRLHLDGNAFGVEGAALVASVLEEQALICVPLGSGSNEEDTQVDLDSRVGDLSYDEQQPTICGLHVLELGDNFLTGGARPLQPEQSGWAAAHTFERLCLAAARAPALRHLGLRGTMLNPGVSECEDADPTGATLASLAAPLAATTFDTLGEAKAATETDAGAVFATRAVLAIGELIRDACGLTSLDLRNCDIGADSATCIAQALVSPWPENVDPALADFDGDEDECKSEHQRCAGKGAQQASGAIYDEGTGLTVSPLAHIDLRGCGLREKGGRKITDAISRADAVKNHPLLSISTIPIAALRADSLEELQLPNRSLCDADGVVLVHMLEVYATKHLKFVNVIGNQLTEKQRARVKRVCTMLSMRRPFV